MSNATYRWPDTPIDVAQIRHPDERAARGVLGVLAIPMCLVLLIYVVMSFGLVAVAAALVYGVLQVIEIFALARVRVSGTRPRARSPCRRSLRLEAQVLAVGLRHALCRSVVPSLDGVDL